MYYLNNSGPISNGDRGIWGVQQGMEKGGLGCHQITQFLKNNINIIFWFSQEIEKIIIKNV